MAGKEPNKFFAPIVIAGFTVGFLVSAYKFVFAKETKKEVVQKESVIEKESMKKHENQE